MAARAVKEAEPGQLVASPEFAAAAGIDSGSLGTRELKGLDEPIELRRLSPPLS